MRKLIITKEIWPLLKPFTISRGSQNESFVLKVEITEGVFTGRGECEPHEFDVTQGDVVEAIIEKIRPEIEDGLNHDDLQRLLPIGPARNAVDCALWDLEAKLSGKRAWEIAGVALTKPLITAYTIGMNPVDVMAEEARKFKGRALLKLKFGAEGSLERLEAVRKAAPDSDIIVDANEAWSFEQLNELVPALKKLGVSLIEQPLPAGKDDQLIGYKGDIPLCADESCLDRGSLDHIMGRYEFINVKLDKTGGLTEALALTQEALKRNLRIMVGCMTGTSLAMAPAMLIGANAEFCDLDGPLLLAKDRDPALIYDDNHVHIPTVRVWG